MAFSNIDAIPNNYTHPNKIWKIFFGLWWPSETSVDIGNFTLNNGFGLYQRLSITALGFLSIDFSNTTLYQSALIIVL